MVNVNYYYYTKSSIHHPQSQIHSLRLCNFYSCKNANFSLCFFQWTLFILKCYCIAVILIVLLKNHFRHTLVSNWFKNNSKQSKRIFRWKWTRASPNVRTVWLKIVPSCNCKIGNHPFLTWLRVYDVVPCQKKTHTQPSNRVHLYAIQNRALCSQRTRIHWIVLVVFSTTLQNSESAFGSVRFG